MSMFTERAFIDFLKREYPSGTHIMVDQMGDDPRPIPPGTKGIVKMVDDIGQIHCVFENGRSLGLVPNEDAFHKIKEKDRGEAR